MGRCLRLTGVAAQGFDVVLTEVAGVGSGVLLLPHVGLTVACAANALRGQTKRGVSS